MKSRMPDDYRIPDDPDAGKMDAAYLRTCYSLRSPPGEEPPELPLAVRRAHYDMARSLSLLGAIGPTGMDATQLATVKMFADRDGALPGEPEPEEYSFMPEIESGRVSPGQKVVINWHNGDRPAHFLQRDGDRVLVLHQGMERKIRADLVRYPTNGEFPDAVDNINNHPKLAEQKE